MLANNFDDLLRQRFEEEEPEYNPAAWTKLAARMDGKRKSANRGLIALWPVTIGIAASVTAAACMLMPAEYARQSPGITEMITAVAPVNIPALPAAPAITILPLSGSSTTTNISSGYTVRTTPVAIASAASSATDTPAHANPAEQAEDNTAATITTVSPKAFYTQPLDKDIEVAPVKRIVISLAGGMQYGSLNTGYAAAINIRHDMGRRWFVETDMGYVQYNASGMQQVTYFNNPAPAALAKSANVAAKASGTGEDPDLASTPGQTTDAPATFKATQRPRVQYLQATPGVGYRVNAHLTVGASVDIQRALIASKEGEPALQDANGKILPLTDLGAAGRMQWNITDGLKAGLSYRRGLNSSLQNKSNYLDRNYLQLQLIVPLTKK